MLHLLAWKFVHLHLLEGPSEKLALENSAYICRIAATLPSLRLGLTTPQLHHAQHHDGVRSETMIFFKTSKLQTKYRKNVQNYISAVFKITQKLLKNYIDILAVFKVRKKIVENYILNTTCTAKRCDLYFLIVF